MMHNVQGLPPADEFNDVSKLNQQGSGQANVGRIAILDETS
jgi:hypothetical protein